MSKQIYSKKFSLAYVRIDRILSGATTLGQSWPRSDGNEAMFCIPQSSSIIGISPSDCLVSYQDTRWEEGLTPQQSGSRYILQPHLTGEGFHWISSQLPCNQIVSSIFTKFPNIMILYYLNDFDFKFVSNQAKSVYFYQFLFGKCKVK